MTKCLIRFEKLFLPQFEWEREYDSLPPLAEVREQTLILYNTRFEDKGRYICKSFLEDGRTTQNYVDLVIKREYRRRRQNRRNKQARRRRTNNNNRD